MPTNLPIVVLMVCRAHLVGYHGPEAKAKAEACMAEMRSCLAAEGEPTIESCTEKLKKPEVK